MTAFSRHITYKELLAKEEIVKTYNEERAIL